MAFPMRFWNTLMSRPLSPSTTGNLPVVITAPVSSMVARRRFMAASTQSARSTGANWSVVLPAREKARRSLMSPCIRLAPSTANSMY